MPTPRSVSNIKSKLFRPALTSHFEVTVPKPVGDGFNSNLKGIGFSLDDDSFNLMCCEATLPGSSLTTHEVNNDFTGATERYAYRRVYDDRIDLSFYVDAENYYPIRYFESWIKYIAGEVINPKGEESGIKSPYYSYRFNYPKYYVSEQGLTVTKFERDYEQQLKYTFINSYPIAITSMPVSYDGSSLLKCTVSFTYIRYVVEPKKSLPKKNSLPPTPKKASEINGAAAFNPTENLGVNYGGVDTTGGSSLPTAQLSGRTTTLYDKPYEDIGVNGNRGPVRTPPPEPLW